MSYIRSESYAQERVRPNLLTHYVGTMTEFIRSQNPTASVEEIDAFVKQVCREKFNPPVVEAAVHPREGYTNAVEMPLDKYIRTVIADNNLSPSGSTYKPVSVQESFLRRTIDEKVKERNAYKKLYLDYEAQGHKRESQFFNLSQANAKIFNNAIPGGMKIKQFILGSKAGFNAVTSIGRICVKQGYSYIERAVNGNIYLPSVEDAITYVINHTRNIPEDFKALVDGNTVYLPTSQEVVDYLKSSVDNYVIHPNFDPLVKMIESLSDHERSYVFYAGCFSNLCRFNETMMRSWIDSCFVLDVNDPSLYQDIDVSEIKSFADDVLTCVKSCSYKLLGLNPDKPGKWNSVKDAVKNNPQGVQKFIYACRHFVQHFEPMVYILRPIMGVEVSFSKLGCQDKMARLTVPLSDTDSNIFSLQELIRWKRGKIDFEPESYQMNALVTFILSQSLEHVFARLSAGLGAEGKDVFRISMKNEFLYPILIATALGKHYLAIATFQEGSLLPTPRKDIKGIGFRSSAYPKLVRDKFEAFVVELFAEIEKGEPISAMSVLNHVAQFERDIGASIAARESIYLQTVSVKRKEDYADPNKSSYFAYELWRDVFAEDYGEMALPNKCFRIPLKGGKKLFKSPEFQDWLQQHHPRIHKKLMAFMEKNDKRHIEHILIPPFKGQVQPLFIEIMDIRNHISQVLAGYYHLLDALGIGSVDKRADALISDFFNPALETVA